MGIINNLKWEYVIIIEVLKANRENEVMKLFY